MLGRRAFIQSSALALGGCTFESEDDIMSFPLAPWHMWGNAVPLSTKIGGLGFVQTNPGQIAKVSYGRPETWRFLFGFTFLTLPPNDAANKLTVIVDFDLIVGIGRTSINIMSFAQFFRSDTPTNLAALGTLWTTAGYTSPITQDPTAQTPVSAPVPIETFVAEEIQCTARVRSAGGVTALAGKTLGVQAHAYFSPNVHIRPEWNTDVKGNEARFRGQENGGK